MANLTMKKSKSMLLYIAPTVLALVTLLLSTTFFFSHAAHAAVPTHQVALNTYPSNTKCVQINEGTSENSNTVATFIQPDGHGNNVLMINRPKNQNPGPAPVEVNNGATYYFKLTDQQQDEYTCTGKTLKTSVGTVPNDNLTFWHLYL